MKLIQSVLLSLVMLLISNVAFSEKMLIPPHFQAPECKYSYDDAAQPRTMTHVIMAMKPICLKKGGLHILHRVLFVGASNEPNNLMLTCVGDNPNLIIFNCLFGTSYTDLLP